MPGFLAKVRDVARTVVPGTGVQLFFRMYTTPTSGRHHKGLLIEVAREILLLAPSACVEGAINVEQTSGSREQAGLHDIPAFTSLFFTEIFIVNARLMTRAHLGTVDDLFCSNSRITRPHFQ